MSVRALALALAASVLAACGGHTSGPAELPAPANVQASSPIPGAIAGTWDPVAGAVRYNVYARPEGSATATAVDVVSAPPLFHDGLAPGARIGLAVSAVDPGPADEGPTSAEVMVDVAPLAEAALVAVGPGHVSLQWTVVSAGTYAVYRSTRAPVDPWDPTTVRLPAATAEYDDASVSAGTTYHYAISGLFGGHESPLGPALTVSTAPAAPDAIVAAGGDRSIALQWSAAQGATSYTPRCGTTAGRPELATAWPATTALTATVGPLQAGTAYSCWIEPENASGPGFLSAEATALTLPGEPLDVLAESSAGAASVTWSPSRSATAYVVTWWSGTSAALTETVQAADACTVLACAWYRTGLVPGETYLLTVTARNATGDGPASAEAAVTISPAPTPVVGARTDRSVSLSWDAVAGADAYVLYRSTSLPLDVATAARLDAGVLLAFVDAAAAPDTTYHYAVAAVTGGIESAPGGTAAATTLPSAPVASASRGPGEGQVTVSWTDGGNRSVTYDVYWSDSGPATLASTRVAGASSPCTLGGLDAATTYHLAVVANGAGGASALSNDAAVVPYPTPKLAEPVAVRGVTAFGQTIPPAPGDLEVFPGQANVWDLDSDLSVYSGGPDGPFRGALWLFAGQLAHPPSYDTLVADTFQLDSLPPDQHYSELSFSTPLFGVADGVRTVAFSGGETLGLPDPAAISGTRSAFLNGTSDSRLAQPLDLRGAATASLQWKQRDDTYAVSSGLAHELGPYFRAVLRDPATGSVVATLAPACGAADATTGVQACTASLAAGVGAELVLSFELRSASPGLVELDDVTVAVDGAAAALLPGGDFEADGAWTAPSPAEPQNVTAGARTLCTRYASTSCAESLRVTRTFFTAPSSAWARIVDVLENPGATAVSADVVYLTLLGSTTDVLYAPAAAGGKALGAFDPSPIDTARDFGIAFGDAQAFYESASLDGAVPAGSFVFLVRPVVVPAGGRVALATFLVLDGLSSGRAGGASAPAIDAAVGAIATGYGSLDDTEFRDWLTPAQRQAIVNW